MIFYIECVYRSTFGLSFVERLSSFSGVFLLDCEIIISSRLYIYTLYTAEPLNKDTFGSTQCMPIDKFVQASPQAIFWWRGVWLNHVKARVNIFPLCSWSLSSAPVQDIFPLLALFADRRGICWRIVLRSPGFKYLDVVYCADVHIIKYACRFNLGGGRMWWLVASEEMGWYFLLLPTRIVTRISFH